MPMCSSLWFLTCLFVAYIFFLFLFKQKKMYNQIFLCFVYLFILAVVTKIELEHGITQLPWHIDVALIASVFMWIGFKLHQWHCDSNRADVRYRTSITILAWAFGSFVIMHNGRINMVQNQYNNLMLFVTGAVLICIPLIEVISCTEDVHNKCKSALAWWGKNTIIFIGFNDLLNRISIKIITKLSLQSLGALIQIVLVITLTSVLIMAYKTALSQGLIRIRNKI